MSVIPRLNRLFGTDGRCFEVAMDHGVHNEPSFLPGIEDLKKTVSAVVAAKPDAILLSLGEAHLLQSLAGKEKPSLVVRSDPTNFYNTPTAAQVFCHLVDDVVEQALALDAVSIVVNLLWAPDQPDLYRQCLSNVSRLKPQCERYGMPLMVEPLVMLPDRRRGGYRPDPDFRKHVALVRQAVELGADVVKAETSEDFREYSKVIVAASPKPVLPRGGSRLPDGEILSRTHALIQQGASGMVYGRNVYQHPHVERMVRACMSIVHENASVAEAAALLNGEGTTAKHGRIARARSARTTR
jgi:class I fructose-bisphosphate aldolase